MDRFGVGRSTRSKVRDWLDNSGYSIATIEDNNEFHFIMTDNVGFRASILQLKNGSPIQVVSPRHTASTEQIAVYQSLDPQSQKEFWRRVRLELLRYGVSFSNLRLEGDGVSFSESVAVSPSLDGREFLRRVLFVRSGARLYQELLLELHDQLRLPTELKAPLTSTGDPQLPPPSQA
jgi:hypothetical protein